MASKTRKSRRGRVPSSLTLRTYRVGFGDCFLLTFAYERGSSRHLLIDFGSTSRPKGAPKDLMHQVADDIVERCGTDPVVIAATHRHKDHISGFSTRKDGEGTGDKIRALNIKRVLQPWTEDPQAEPDAQAPTHNLSGHQARVGALRSMHTVASNVLREVASRKIGKETKREIEFVGDDNLTNRSAVENLASMATNRYLYFGANPGTGRVLAGVDIQVLGPPTLEQTETILGQRSKDSDEFWHLVSGAAGYGSTSPRSLFPAYVDTGRPPERRWFEARLNRVRTDQLLSIVRALDDAMNNTSLILLLKVGKLRLLFPGDAQIENWQYALNAAKSDRKLLADLKAVNVYKVGHHGSLNATPKSLWDLFTHRSAKKSEPRMQSVLSTLPGKHGKTRSRTEVPRKTLVEALEKQTDFFSTTSLTKKTDLYHDIEFDVR